VGDLRFELRTNRLRVYCSTVELVTHTEEDDSKLLINLLARQMRNLLKDEFNGKSSLACCTLYIN
jgi:hypothetical protein